jgi:hypothetical protein
LFDRGDGEPRDRECLERYFYPVNPYTALRKYRLAVCGGKTSAVNLRQAEAETDGR